MSNRAALVVFLLIVLVLGVVLATVEGSGVFLARKFADVVHWVAFWR